MAVIHKTLTRFLRDDDGSMSVELLLVTPILTWVLLSTWVYFDAYQTESTVIRASNVVADMYSRETAAITTGYVDSSYNVFRLMTRNLDTHEMRVTVIHYDEPNDKHSVVWSQARGSGVYTALTTPTIGKILDQVPDMYNNQQIAFVETRGIHRPVFNVGLGTFTGAGLSQVTFDESAPTAIRYAQKLCFDPTPSSGSPTEICDPV